MENLNQVLKNHRKNLGLTQMQLTEKMSVSLSTIKQYDSGPIQMGWTFFTKALGALGYKAKIEIIKSNPE